MRNNEWLLQICPFIMVVRVIEFQTGGKEIQIVYRLFLVSCYLLQEPQ